MDAMSWKRLEKLTVKLRREVMVDPTSATVLTLLSEANACDSRFYLWVWLLPDGRGRLCLRASTPRLPALNTTKYCDLVEVVRDGCVTVIKDRDETGGSSFAAHEDIPLIYEEAPTLWARLALEVGVPDDRRSLADILELAV